MATACFTSISFSYLAKARVLGRTLKEHHPDWRFYVCITDREPPGYEFLIEDEPFDEVIWADQLPVDDVLSWLFKHDIVEVCTAVKGPVLELLTRTEADKIFYLDPDIAVVNSLEPLVKLLDAHSILLTPHQLAPDRSLTAIADNEIGSLKHGVYNLGFVAIRNDEVGRAMAGWWRFRLENFCYDDPARGLFVDQRWCDLIPSFFDNVHIIKDPGYNVASWNISQRLLTIDADGQALVNGQPLRFFHFTKLGPVGDAMTQRYARDNVVVYEVWSWYRRLVAEHVARGIPDHWWHFGQFSNGAEIARSVRLLYRDRRDLQAAFPDPYDASSEESYWMWLQANEPALHDLCRFPVVRPTGDPDQLVSERIPG
jgi:hypothetical protein